MKIYKDSKELPFLIYKKIMQTGDFLYMIKGYEDGDEVEADPEKLSVLKTRLEDKFNDLITDFVISINGISEEMTNHVNHTIATLEYNKLTLILNIIDLLIKSNELLNESTINKEDESILNELLEGVKVARSPEIKILRQNIVEKISVYESNLLKYKEIMESSKESEQENDLDKQFINVCLGLEIPFPDESKISLYQFSIMIDKVVEKAKALEKINNKS